MMIIPNSKKGETDTKILLSIFFFMAFLGFLVVYANLPSGFQFVNVFDFTWFIGGAVTIGGTCVIATGLPCAGALAIFSIATFWNYIIVQVSWVELLIFTPIVAIIMIIMIRIARGQ